jgi:hypothetical protein
MLDPHATKYHNASVVIPYDATLNQTDIATNKNKFYIIQLLKHGSDFSLYTRYGRIGEVGVISYTLGQESALKDKFKTAFKSKTKNNWIDDFGNPSQAGSKFTKFADKYFLCQKSLVTAPPTTINNVPATTTPGTNSPITTQTPTTTGATGTTGTTGNFLSGSDKNTDKISTIGTIEVPNVRQVKPLIIVKKPFVIKQRELLDRRIVQFLELVGSMKMLHAALKCLNVDTEKMPLGQISQEQLSKADIILNEIKDLLGKGSVKDDKIFMTKSSEYYTLVPICVSRSSRPPVINTMEIIGKYSDRIDELRNLKLAYTAVNDSTNVDQEAQYENLYKSLKTSIVPIDRDTSIWKIIEDYVLKTHGHTHTNTCRVKIENIYEITRESDANRDYPGTLNNSPDQNLQLLWHGTRLTNFISILQNGLVLRPELISNAKITGKMFGNGIYAANSFSKSLNYCGFGDTNNDACLFLGEFVLGKQLEKTQSDSGLNEKILLSQGYHSTWAKGKDTPSSFTTISSSFDKSKLVRVPNGPLIASQIKSSLLYDEFIVYNEQQLRLRFIVQIKVL